MSETITSSERILRYFCNVILASFSSETGPLLKKRWRIASTAVVYFRRFYGINKLRDFDPRLAILCAIFLAGKTEEQVVTIPELQKISNKFDEESLLNGEIKLLETLQFDLKIYHPHNCVNAFIADFKLFCFEHLRDINTMNSKQNNDNTSIDNQSAAVISETLEKSTKLFSILGAKWLKKSEMVVRSLQLTSAIVEHSALTLAVVALHISFDACDPTAEGEAVTETVDSWPVSFDVYLQRKFGTSTETETKIRSNFNFPEVGVETFGVLQDLVLQVERRFYYIEPDCERIAHTVQQRIAAVTDSIGGDAVTASFLQLKNEGCEWYIKSASR